MYDVDPASSPLQRGAERRAARPPTPRRILMAPAVRILLAAVAFLVLQTVLGVGSGLLLPVSWQGPLLTQILSLAAALAVFAFVVRAIERRPLAAGGLALTLPGALVDTGRGFLVGAAMLGAAVGGLVLAGMLEVAGVGVSSDEAAATLLTGLLLFLLVAVGEEVLFRGVLFRVVEEGLGSWPALVLTGALFGGVHLMNANATLLGAAGAALMGVILGAAYVATRDLWLAIGIHWAWNFATGTVFGLPVSGRDAGGSLLASTTNGPAHWTGGAFGPEAGLATLLLLLVVAGAMLAFVTRRDRLVTPPWLRPRSGMGDA